jgi:hypothetical protein
MAKFLPPVLLVENIPKPGQGAGMIYDRVSYKRAADEEALPLYPQRRYMSGKGDDYCNDCRVKAYQTIRCHRITAKSLSKRKQTPIKNKRTQHQRALNAHIGEYNSMCILTNAYRRGYFWIFVIKSKKNS